jgi:AcrR family transcriptional regulator
LSRTGRRPGAPDTRDEILAVARRRFATYGYDATSLRSIATAARVDPALLIHYFGTKEGLFTEAVGFPVRLSELLAAMDGASLPETIEALVRGYLHVVDSDQSRNAILALIRSAVSQEKAAAMLREFLTAEVLGGIAALTALPNAPLRASLVAAQLVGIAMLRHVVRVGPVAEATPDEIVALVAPVIERYLRSA